MHQCHRRSPLKKCLQVQAHLLHLWDTTDAADGPAPADIFSANGVLARSPSMQAGMNTTAVGAGKAIGCNDGVVLTRFFSGCGKYD